MLRRAGVRLRTTNGNATRVCASGISKGEVRKSSGGRLSATMNPSPSVTAEVPNGSISSGSRMRLNTSCWRLASIQAAGSPNKIESTTVPPA